MICPICKGNGERSRVTIADSGVILVPAVHYPETWDEDGNLVAAPHPPLRFECSRGHRFSATSRPNLANVTIVPCDMPDEADEYARDRFERESSAGEV